MINYTPHEVRIVDENNIPYSYPASGTVARVHVTSSPAEPLGFGVPTITVSYGAAELPEGHPRQCLVSTMFADAYRRQHGQNDVELFVPDSGPTAIRRDGQIVAVRALIRR